MVMRIFLLLPTILFACSATPTAEQSRGPQVRAFVDAFNAHDAQRMATMVTEDVEWMSIDGAKAFLETAGRTVLVASMQRYFKSCPSCRSTVAIGGETPSRVTAIEVASWKTGDIIKRQQAVVVYEFAGTLIRRVTYFPAEPLRIP